MCLGSLVRPLKAGEKMAIGGFALNTLKKLNGAKFLLPFKSIVLAKQRTICNNELLNLNLHN